MKLLFEVDGWMNALHRVKCIGVKEQEQDHGLVQMKTERERLPEQVEYQ